MIQEVLAPFYKAYLHGKRSRLFKRQRWEELAEVSRQLLALNPSDYRALNDLAVASFELREYEEALRICRDTFKAAPKVRADLQFAAEGARYMRYLLIYAQVLLKEGELEKARRALEKLKAMGPHFHEKFLLLSKLHEKEGSLAKAAAELEEMQRVYEKRNGLWGAEIRARSQAVLERAFEKRDADASLFAARTIVRSSVQASCLEESLETAQGAPGGAALAAALEACVHLAVRRPSNARESARKTGWPELEGRFDILALIGEGRAREAFSLLAELPPESPFHLEQLLALKGPGFASLPEYLRDCARCQLKAGRLEEAQKALQDLNAAGQAVPGDIEAIKEVRRLLLERAIWEDEKLLGGHPDPEEDLTSRVLSAGPGKEINRLSDEEIKLRLAKNRALAAAETSQS